MTVVNGAAGTDPAGTLRDPGNAGTPSPLPRFHGAFQWDKGPRDPTVLTQKFPGASPGAPGVPVAAGDRKTWN